MRSLPAAAVLLAAVLATCIHINFARPSLDEVPSHQDPDYEPTTPPNSTEANVTDVSVEQQQIPKPKKAHEIPIWAQILGGFGILNFSYFVYATLCKPRRTRRRALDQRLENRRRSRWAANAPDISQPYFDIPYSGQDFPLTPFCNSVSPQDEADGDTSRNSQRNPARAALTAPAFMETSH